MPRHIRTTRNWLKNSVLGRTRTYVSPDYESGAFTNLATRTLEQVEGFEPPFDTIATPITVSNLEKCLGYTCISTSCWTRTNDYLHVKQEPLPLDEGGMCQFFGKNPPQNLVATLTPPTFRLEREGVLPAAIVPRDGIEPPSHVCNTWVLNH